MIVYRPVGLKELELIAATQFASFPPRLPHQPIFSPVLNVASMRIHIMVSQTGWQRPAVTTTLAGQEQDQRHAPRTISLQRQCSTIRPAGTVGAAAEYHFHQPRGTVA